MKKSKLSNAIHSALAISLTGIIASTAIAEEVASDESLDKVEKIQITGSRIARFELSQPAPIISITGEEIEQAGIPDLASVLAELPAIGATGTIRANSNSNGSAGMSTVDLRRLGVDRTLVLVNGKRHVSGEAGSSTVDLSTIPSALIKTVEVTTGGASAVYGSDAVSGVVNIILKKDFEGLELSASYSDSTEGVGSKNSAYSLVGGVNSEDGKGNVTFFVTKDTIEEVMTKDMPNFNLGGHMPNPENTGEDDGIFDELWVPNVVSEYVSPNGVLRGGGINYTFSNDGIGEFMPTRGLFANSAFASFPDGCKYCFSPEDYVNYLPQRDKVSTGALFNYAFNDNVELYGDFKYVRSDIAQQFQPSFRFGQNRIKVADNPYLSAADKKVFADRGLEEVQINKFLDEIGNRSAKNKRETFTLMSGLRGAFTLSDTIFDYDVYYSYGRTENDRITENDLILGNWAAAIDAVIDPNTGKADCRSNVSEAQPEGYQSPETVNIGGCVPYNPFGFGQASAEAMDWITADVTRSDAVKQRFVGGSASFDTAEFFELQGGAVGFAFGYEKRWESSETITDELTRSNVLSNSATPNVYGEYDVSEWFVETRLPILADVFLAHELSVDAAFRRADYSHTGEADAWKVGFMWSPLEGYSLRGTFGEAVRAPNIAESFSPRSPGFGRVTDPCDVDNISDNPNRVKNCAALGIPANFQAEDNVSKETLTGGNPNLNPEEAESLTLGFVFTPIEGLSASIDYFDIEITDAIQSLTIQTVADNCVDGPDLDTVFCGQVTRDPATMSITRVESGYLNTAKLKVKGVEADIHYNTDLTSIGLPGDLKLKWFVSHLIERNTFQFQNRPELVKREHGELGDPEWQSTFRATYAQDNWSATWYARFIDRSALIDLEDTLTESGEERGESKEDQEHSYTGSFITHDISAKYRFDKASVEVGFRNVFDKILPDYVDGRGANSSLYDPWGRKVFVNLKYNF
ncbi:TonB-dependent receptor domain-containing protein [Pseudoalteromonas sp. NC201]|uniref:TonB-dependent receptor domain-containing protein n=1 Tax=Pseudoalteromonas sp. NC201 TaxID=1514074 RepID=UPI000C7C2A43|nr:TonB-dependent receptor [Pseudoalteromonas sp. NC201]AUJ69975.1 Vitamin B12 transporter BtuB precursor [Pseudoalteromonas sp. NC201]